MRLATFFKGFFNFQSHKSKIMACYFLNLAFVVINFHITTSYVAPEPITFCPLVDFKGNILYYFDKTFSVSKSVPVRVITECSLECYQDASCKGFTFGKNSSNCTLHYTLPAPMSTTIAQNSISTSRLSTYMIGGFSIYPYRYPYPCLLPFTLSGRLYSNSCAPVLPDYPKCNIGVCPVQVGSVVEIRQCAMPNNSIQVKTSISTMACLRKTKEISILETGRAWILIQRKKWLVPNLYNTEQNRNWTDFKQGFGTPEGDYWVGNDYLYGLTSNLCMTNVNESVNYRLRIEMADNKGRWYSVEYKSFKVDSEATNYKLNLTGYDELMSDLADGFGLADQPAPTQSGTSKFTTPWSVWNCNLPCKVIGFTTNDARPNENCTLPTGWWYSSTQLNCQTSLHIGNLNSPMNQWPNKRGLLPPYIYQFSEIRAYIGKA